MQSVAGSGGYLHTSVQCDSGNLAKTLPAFFFFFKGVVSHLASRCHCILKSEERRYMTENSFNKQLRSNSM